MSSASSKEWLSTGGGQPAGSEPKHRLVLPRIWLATRWALLHAACRLQAHSGIDRTLPSPRACHLTASPALPAPLAGPLCRDLQARYGLESNRGVPDWGRAIFSPLCIIVRPQSGDELGRFLKYALALTQMHVQVCGGEVGVMYVSAGVVCGAGIQAACAASAISSRTLSVAVRRPSWPGAAAFPQKLGPQSPARTVGTACEPQRRASACYLRHSAQIAKIAHPIGAAQRRRLELLHAAHRRFCEKQLENDKTRRVLEVAFGAELAAAYMREVMFDCPVQLELPAS